MTKNPRAADEEDVRAALLLFFGETQPTAAQVEARVGSRPGGLVKRFLTSTRFKANVLDRLAAGRPVIAPERPAEVPAAAISWLARALKRPQLGKDLSARPLDWTAFYTALLTDERFLSSARALGLPPDWAAAIAVQPPSAALQSAGDLLGEIEAFDGHTVSGWALDPNDVARNLAVEVFAGRYLVGVANCRLFRQRLGDFGGDGHHGFRLVVSPELTRAIGANVFDLSMKDAVTGVEIGGPFRHNPRYQATPHDLLAIREAISEMQDALEVLKKKLPSLVRSTAIPLEQYTQIADDWSHVSDQERRSLKRDCESLGYRPKFSVVIPAYNSDPRLLQRTLESVRAQIYPDYEVVLSDGGSANGDEIREVAARVFSNDPRLVFVEAASELGISANTNLAVSRASGDYVAFLDHDDMIAQDALSSIAGKIQDRTYKLIYTDEDRFEWSEGRAVHWNPFFKPDLDYHLLLSMNYITHFLLIRRDALAEAGSFDEAFDGAQDHDMILRVLEKTEPADVLHVPQILYHWHLTEGSVSRSDRNVQDIEAKIRRLVGAHLRRVGDPAAPHERGQTKSTERKFSVRVNWKAAAPPSVSIVIPTRDRLDLLRPCLDSVHRSLAAYEGEATVIVVDNDSADPKTLSYLEAVGRRPDTRLLKWSGSFNWSAINNRAASEAAGDVLLFLNNDTLVQSDDWLGEMASLAVRPKVGAVGARLLYADGTIQHAGVVVGVGDVAGHEGAGLHVSDGGYFGRHHLVHQTSAVTGACLAVRKALFEEVGGFDAETFKIAFNDVDFCLKLQALGYANLYTPYATLYHFESRSRGYDRTAGQRASFLAEFQAFGSRWAKVVGHDPFYNPNFSRAHPPFTFLRQAQ